MSEDDILRIAKDNPDQALRFLNERLAHLRSTITDMYKGELSDVSPTDWVVEREGLEAEVVLLERLQKKLPPSAS